MIKGIVLNEISKQNIAPVIRSIFDMIIHKEAYYQTETHSSSVGCFQLDSHSG